MNEQEELEKIRRNAELVVQQMSPVSGLAFDYDAESVEWLDGFINRQRAREEIDKETVESLISILGSYLGECLRRNFGGEWKASEYGWGIFFSERHATFPFSKTRKQFENGEEDSIYSFFELIPTMFGTGSPVLEGEESPLTVAPKKSRWKFWER
jgi:hypothetical protein